MGTTEDRLFERWCRQGDAEALGELFDLASPGLLRLAIHLVGEPAEAEDLVQATFLAAIEQRASVDSSRPVLPWLTAVLSNKAADHKRRASRSLDVERLLQSAEDDASHPVEQRELSGELAKAIDALEEPYRQVMILRLRHGLSPADIAHVLERSPGAVRVQLHRAQQKLRGRLPSTLAGAFLVGAAAPRGLAAVRAELMSKALSLAPATSAAAASATVLGGLVVGNKVAVAIVAGLVAAGIWWAASRDVSPLISAPAQAADGQLSPLQAHANAELLGSRSEDQRDAIRSEPSEEVDPYGSLDIEVVWHDGTPAAGVGLEQVGSWSTLGRSTYWRTDDSGRVHIDRIRAGPRGFMLDRFSLDPIFLRTYEAEVKAGANSFLRVEIPAGRDVRAMVVDARGKAVGGAELWGLADLGSESLIGTAAQDGSCLVRSLSPSKYSLCAKVEQRGISPSVEVSELQADPRGIYVAELRLSATTAEFAGRVVGIRGEPVADADVIVALHADTSVSRKRFRQRTQADGSFRFGGLCRSMITVEVGAVDYPLWSTSLDLDDGESQWLDVHLVSGVTVEGTVRGPDEAPAGVTVEWAENSRLSYAGDLGWKRVHDSDPAPDAFRLVGLPPGPIRLQALNQGPTVARASTTLHGMPGETLRWDAVLESDDGVIVGRVVDDVGRPQVRWYVNASTQGNGGSLEPTDSEGRFVLRNCTDADHVVRLQWPGKKTMTPVAERDFVRPGGDEVLFVVSPGMVPTAGVTGVILDSQAEPVENLFVSALDERGDSKGRSTYEPDGRFQIELLSAGHYRLVCNSRRIAQEVLGSFELKPDEVLDLGTKQLSLRGFLEVTMHRRDGALLSGPQTRVVGDEGRFVSLTNETTDDGTVYRTPALVPGRYLVYPTFTNAAGAMREVWIRAGETTSLAIELEPGARFVLDFHVPARVEPPSVLNLAIRDKGGATVLQSDCRYFSRYRDGRWIHRFVGSLPVGGYSYEASTTESLVASGDFEIGVLDLPVGFDVELTQKP